MKAEMLEREFRPRAAAPGGERPRLRAADALALIDRAAEEGVPILHVDGFRAADGAPDALHGRAADFSAAVAEGHGCWADAEAFIRAQGETELVFELTLGDDPIEVV